MQILNSTNVKYRKTSFLKSVSTTFVAHCSYELEKVIDRPTQTTLLPDFTPWRPRYESVNYGISNYWSTQNTASVINYIIMTSQCAWRTFKIYTIKETGVLTIVILCCYNNCNSVRVARHFFVNFDIFKWLYVGLLTIGPGYTKLGNFVKLCLHFMTIWINSC